MVEKDITRLLKKDIEKRIKDNPTIIIHEISETRSNRISTIGIEMAKLFKEGRENKIRKPLRGRRTGNKKKEMKGNGKLL